MLLLPHQQEAIKRAIKNRRYIWFLPTGSGKTLAALIYIKLLGVPSLIVCPARIKEVWFKENNKFNIGLDVSDNYLSNPSVCVVSYEYARRYPEVFDDYELIVFDEAYYLSDVETLRYGVISKSIKDKHRLLLLSGYPVENHLTEIYGLASLISPGILGNNYYHFLHKYFKVIHDRRTNRIIKVIPKSNSFNRIVSVVSNISYIIPKGEVVDVGLNINVIRYKLTEQQKLLLGDLFNRLEVNVGGVRIRCKNRLVAFQKALQVISGFIYVADDDLSSNYIRIDASHKIDVLKYVVGEGCIVWYYFNAEKDILEQNKISVPLYKLRSESRGLNLQHFKYAVYYSIPTSGGQFYQSVDRLHRYGRKREVNAVVLLPEGKFGDGLKGMLDRKFTLKEKFIVHLLNKLKVEV